MSGQPQANTRSDAQAENDGRGGESVHATRPRRRPISLYRRMTVIVSSLVLATALVGGVLASGALLLGYHQQVRYMLENGQAATGALYAAERERWVEGIELIARRPTLSALVASQDEPALLAYLDGLRRDTGADALQIVTRQGQRWQVGAALSAAADEFLAKRPLPVADFIALEGRGTLAILAAAPLAGAPESQVTVLALQELDQAFLQALARQTGLEQSILVGGARRASSLPFAPGWGLSAQSAERLAGGQAVCCSQVKVETARYSIGWAPLVNQAGEVVAISESALPVDALWQRTLLILGLFAGSLLLLAAATSLISVHRTWSVIRPLRELSAAAERFRSGDLDKPLISHSPWLEINDLAAHLDDWRQMTRDKLELSRREAQRLALLLNVVREGIVTIDHERRVTWLNSDAEQLLDCRMANALRRHVVEIFRPDPRAEHTILHLLDEHDESAEAYPIRLLNCEGQPITLAVTITNLKNANFPDGRGEKALILRDITAQHTINQLRTELLTSLAHELRTPLSSILASTELLQDELPEMTPQEANELVQAAQASALHLQTLVNNLLESASIEAGIFQLRYRPVIFQEVLQEALQIIHPLLQRRRQVLRLEVPTEPIALRLDPGRISQVIVNLVGNAHKYSPEGETILLSVQSDGQTLRVSVEDRGPGFPEGRLDRVFEGRFGALYTPGRPAGLGLGLAIVKSIVQAHQGQVGAENNPAGGARVWFTLPIQHTKEVYR